MGTHKPLFLKTVHHPATSSGPVPPALSDRKGVPAAGGERMTRWHATALHASPSASRRSRNDNTALLFGGRVILQRMYCPKNGEVS